MTIAEVQRQYPDFCKSRCCAGRFGWCMAYIDNEVGRCIMPGIEKEIKLWQMERRI